LQPSHKVEPSQQIHGSHVKGKGQQQDKQSRTEEAAAYTHPMQQKKERPHLTQQQMEQQP
jgi:hypothetical protein